MRAPVVVMVVMMFGGCWHDAPRPAMPTQTSSDAEEPILRHRRPAPIDCQALIPTVEGMLASAPAFQPKIAEIVETITTSCVEDVWSVDVIECFIASADESHLNECARQFTTTQAEGLQRRLMTVMTMSSPNAPTP